MSEWKSVDDHLSRIFISQSPLLKDPPEISVESDSLRRSLNLLHHRALRAEGGLDGLGDGIASHQQGAAVVPQHQIPPQDLPQTVFGVHQLGFDMAAAAAVDDEDAAAQASWRLHSQVS